MKGLSSKGRLYFQGANNSTNRLTWMATIGPRVSSHSAKVPLNFWMNIGPMFTLF